MVELEYESKFDGFRVEFVMGSAEEVNNGFFGGEEVLKFAQGATVMPAENCGCLVWVETFDGTPERIATLFHELVHASVIRLRKNGMLNREPSREDLENGFMSFDEALAHSVKELGDYILGELYRLAEEQGEGA